MYINGIAGGGFIMNPYVFVEAVPMAKWLSRTAGMSILVLSLHVSYRSRIWNNKTIVFLKQHRGGYTVQ